MKVKISILIDEKVWNAFKLLVQSETYTNQRKLSKFVEEALRSFNTVNIVEEFTSRYNLSSTAYYSSKEIKQKRPKVSFSTGAIVREMRNKREEHLLGF